MRDLKYRRDDPEILRIRAAHARDFSPIGPAPGLSAAEGEFRPEPAAHTARHAQWGRWTSHEGGQPQSAHPRGGAP